MQKAAKFLNDMEIPFEVNALSAHRTPEQVEAYAAKATKEGVKVIIAGAGGAAHLPGVMAAFTPLPIIGVPCRSSISIDGGILFFLSYKCLQAFLLLPLDLMALTMQPFLPCK